MEITPIEMKEIRGITPKALVWLLCSTISIVGSVIITSSQITNKLETYIIKQDGINSLQDMRIKNNEDKINRNGDDIKEVRKEVEIIKSITK